MLSPQKVYDYFWSHFYELPPYEQFHFAHRLFSLKNNQRANIFFSTLAEQLQAVSQQDQWDLLSHYLVNKTPVTDLKRNEFLMARPMIRQLVWDAYTLLFSKKLFSLNLSKLFFNRWDNAKVRENYFSLRDSLECIALVSTYAVNFLILSNAIFKFEDQGQLIQYLVKLTTKLYPDPEAVSVQTLRLYLYYVTHLVIATTLFYELQLTNQQKKLFKPLFENLEAIIFSRFDEVSLDCKLEFLVSSKLAGHSASEKLINKISEQAAMSTSKQGSFCVEVGVHADPQKNGFSRSEHRSVFYLLAFYEQIKRL